jgi:hypothetical protein
MNDSASKAVNRLDAWYESTKIMRRLMWGDEMEDLLRQKKMRDDMAALPWVRKENGPVRR